MGGMPLVFRYKAYRFFFYSNEGSPRELMHIHVRSAEGDAKFWVQPEVRLADSAGYNAPQLRELAKVVADHAELIERSWNEHFT